MSINPADQMLIDIGFHRPLSRKDDIVAELVGVRAKQDRLVADLGGLRPAPSIQRLRESADVRREFEQVFRDLELAHPAPRDDANPIGARLDHLRPLQRFCPQWRETKLGRVAAADVGGFELIARDIVRDARRVASNPTQGSVHRPGALRPITRVDAAGHKTVQWCGDPFSWMCGFYDPTLRCLVAVGDGYGRWYP